MATREERSAFSLMVWTNKRFGTKFVDVLHAAVVERVLQAVVKDSSGYLWLCRVETIDSERACGLGGHRKEPCVPRFLMPFYGPCPDPIEELPLGYHPETTALLAQASALIKRGRIAA